VWRNRYEKLAPVEKYTSARSAEEGEHERLASLRKSTDTSKLTASHIQLVTDFVENVYFPAKKNVLKPSTITGYRDFYSRNLKPEFGLMRMTDVNLATAQGILNSVAKKNPNISPGALNHLKWLGVAIFEFAAKNGAFNSDAQNPFRRVDIPPTKYETRPARHVDLDTVVKMIAVLDEPAVTVVAVAAFTGLRKSELQGLRWEDLRDGKLFVQRTAWRPTTVVDSTKTKPAKASVPVLPVLAKYLEAHRNGFPFDGFIFAGPKKGLPLDLHNLYARVIKDKLKKAEIPWAGWHGFRRGLATTLYKLGTDPKTRMAILRHAKIAVTEEIYTQSVDAVSRAALRKVEKLFEQKRKTAKKTGRRHG
jgi:integrase